MGLVIPWLDQEDDIIIREFRNGLFYKDMVQYLPNRSEWAIRNRALFLGLSKRNNLDPYRSCRSHPKYIISNKNLFRSPNQTNCYWAGFIAADGCIYKEKNTISIHLSITDLEHLENLKEALGYSGPIRFHKDGSVALVISRANVILTDLYKNFNIVEKKSLVLEPPLGLSLSNCLSFIIGYIDGDGSLGVFKRKNTPFLSIVGTYGMLEWIQGIFNDICPIESKVKIRKAGKSKAFQYTLDGRKAQSIIKILYSIKGLSRLQRKWNSQKIDKILEKEYKRCPKIL